MRLVESWTGSKLRPPQRPYVVNHMDVSSGNEDADKTGRIRATSDKLDGRKQFDVSVDIDGKRVIV